VPWATIRAAEPGVLGDPAHGPWDRILVSAMAESLPQALVDQLADDGVLVVPGDGVMLRVTNPGAVVTAHGHYRFVPLR
jgi:protein-L-isoaspartate(D-aspartate) O-methyltransferase